MQKTAYILLLIISLTSCAGQPVREPASLNQELPQTHFMEMVGYPQLGLRLRAGYSLETRNLKGCVLYLQGLADSIQNHTPFFSRLNQAGYRVIYFDYMGQGGSEGSMNNTRVQIELPSHVTTTRRQTYEARDKHYEIPEQGDFFWSRYNSVKNSMGQDCRHSPKIVMGWSTGGLAAFRMAYEKRAHAVILIAPGIHPKLMVGESARRWDKMLMFRQTITEQTLTRNRFQGQANPHVDPITPKSPAHVPLFGGNLVGVAHHSTQWKIDESVRGIVFLSGAEDSYVDREPTLKTLSRNAPHFEVIPYEGALHELDNELPDVAGDLYGRSIRFLDSITLQ